MFGYSLSGRVAGGAAQVGFVTLVVHDEAVAGSIWTPDATYELSYLGGGVHALRDVTNAPSFECAGTVSAAEAQRAQPTVWPENTRAEEVNTVVDVLVVWTPAAEEDAGGEVSMLSLIDRDVAFANDAFERSGVFVSLNLVGAERVDYLERDIHADLARLATLGDGHMDSVHDLRDALGADLVHLKVRSLVGPAGVAERLGAFGISQARSSVFAHEVGHNFGMLHERGEFTGAGLAGIAETYSHGFTTAACLATMMSYGAICGGRVLLPSISTRIPYYGSPWRYGPTGRVLGVSRFSKDRGLHGPADAVLTLNRNRHHVADLRPSRNGE